MNRKRVIVSKLFVFKKQVKNFQVKLPRDTVRVLGVEMGLQWLDDETPPLNEVIPAEKFGLVAVRNFLIGDLVLQSSDTANIFYAGETRLNRNAGFGDFTVSQFKPSVFTHNGNLLHEHACISGKGKLISGTYRDRLHETDYANDYRYQLRLYVWVETQQKGGGT